MNLAVRLLTIKEHYKTKILLIKLDKKKKIKSQFKIILEEKQQLRVNKPESLYLKNNRF